MSTKANVSSKMNMSVQKTIRIIEVLARASVPMRLSEIAAQVEMPVSTVFRMLNTLVDCGYAYQECEGQQRYGLTMRFVQIGQMVADHFSIREISHPYLVALSEEVGESCCLSIEENQKVLYVDVVENTSSAISIRQKVGGTAPMHCTGSGKLLLTCYSPEQLEEYVRKNGLPALTRYTLTTQEDLAYAVSRVRENGYATDEEECEIGMRCLAAPIWDANGRVIAALSISGPISRMTKLRCDVELLPRLRKCAQKITEKVGGVKPL